jgi:hypothetical protein
MKSGFLSALITLSLVLTSHAADVTLTVNNNASRGVIKTSDSVVIETNESATIVGTFYVTSDATLEIIRNGITNWFSPANVSASTRGATISGPATITLFTSGSPTFVTLRIAPESFPPDKTIIIPQGTPGANIIMEQSTDLINWTNSVPGSYTNTAMNHLFFRLRAERL